MLYVKITELEIYNIDNCKHAHLKLQDSEPMSSVYLINSSHKCEIISLAIQLICSSKYAKLSTFQEITDKIINGKVNLTFTLSKSQQEVIPNLDVLEHSSDDDVPCTSREALARQERRRRRRQEQRYLTRSLIEVKACRNFTNDPDTITYSVEGYPLMRSSAEAFQVRFFSCTDIIFPRLSGLSYGEYCNGNWLNLLSTEVIHKSRDGNKLIVEFSKLFANRKIRPQDSLCSLTTVVIKSINSLNNAILSQLIQIFNDIRWMFEYITCSEYTVWFLLPTLYGDLQDISKITTENVDFDKMKTFVQIKTAEMDTPKFIWTKAEGHIQELLLVAVQLAFGYNCEQNIIYLHSLDEDFLRKNYFQRIFNICASNNICCIIEYSGGLPFYPHNAFVIKCDWLDSTNEWKFYLKNFSSNEVQTTNYTQTFISAVEEINKV